MEHELGSVTPGKAANFTVLAEDPYAAPPSRLGDIGILGTMFGAGGSRPTAEEPQRGFVAKRSLDFVLSVLWRPGDAQLRNT